jgi:Hypothetical protein (DUF2513)
MKRDMDLCREIMRQIEAHTELNRPVKIEVEGRSAEDITYQLHQLQQARLIEAINVPNKSGLAYLPLRLTWQGHEFLDAARDDTIWRRGKERVLKAAGGLTFDLLLAALKAEIRSRTGLDL